MATSNQLSNDEASTIRKPFDLDSIIGFNPSVPVLNLTVAKDCGERRVCVAVAAAHIISIHTGSIESSSSIRDPTATVQHLVGGHSFIVHTLCSDVTGRFILSAGAKACVIWDRQYLIDGSPAAIRELFRPYGANGRIEHAALSPDGKYILLSGVEEESGASKLQFWLWTSGRQRPECESVLPTHKHGPVRVIAFNPFNIVRGAEFAITLQRAVLFGHWTVDRPDTLSVVRPRKSRLLNVTDFRATAFCEQKGTAISISTEGTCTVWSREIGSIVYTAEKTMRVDTVPLVSIHYVDEMVAVLAADGRLRFFDSDMRIVYDCNVSENRVNAQLVAFNLERRRYRLVDRRMSTAEAAQMSNRNSRYKSFSADPNIEVLYTEWLPRCTTTDKRTFIVRNSLQLDRQGRLQHCDLVQQQTVELPLLVASIAHVTAFDVHPRRSMLCAGCTDGRLFLYDFGRGELVLERTVPKGGGVRFVRFIADGNEVLVAYHPRTVALVDSIMLAPIGRTVRPAGGSRAAVQLICVSTKASRELIAYVEADNSLVLLQREVGADGVPQLRMIGNHLAHADEIVCIRFAGVGDGRLLTFADDRHLTEYDTVASVAAGELVMVQRRPYDQTAKVTAALSITPSSDGASDLLTFDNTMKVKFWHADRMSQILRTVVGPVLDDQPVRCVCHIPRVVELGTPNSASRPSSDATDDFVAFATRGRTLGLHLLPFDGNAFRHVGMMVHPHNVLHMFATADGRSVLTLGRDDYAVFQWRIRRDVVLESMQRGGSDLMPFCRALPAGRDGWLFREMQDLFYYMQILKRSIDSPDEQMVADALYLTEVPDYMRGLGLFLSEFEVQNVLVELSDNRVELAARVQVSFGDLVRVYVNHRPTNGYAISELQSGMKAIATGKQLLDRDRLMEMCCKLGEPMGWTEAARYLVALLSADDGPPLLMAKPAGAAVSVKEDKAEARRLLANLPELFSVQDFLENVFGLETTARKDDVDGFSFLYDQCDDPGKINHTLNNEPKDT